MSHYCHVPYCTTNCPPRHLMCLRHWDMVPADLQNEVYETVKKRGTHVDASWSPWWSAQAKAIHAAMVREGREKEQCDKWLKKELEFVTTLEKRDEL